MIVSMFIYFTNVLDLAKISTVSEAVGKGQPSVL